VLLDVMYEIPTLEGVRRCIVNADVINNRTRPLLVTVGERAIEYEKTA
jgi:ATP-dependent Clp protease ATP-binding subunit ClpX